MTDAAERIRAAFPPLGDERGARAEKALAELLTEIERLQRERDELKLAAGAEAQLANEYHARVARLETAYRQACTNLATVRPEGYDLSLGEIADLYYDALLAGWGGILGWPEHVAREALAE